MEIVKLLWTRKEAALTLSMSVRWIDDLIARGLVQTRRLGGAVRIPAHEIERLARKGVSRTALRNAVREPGKRSDAS